MKHDDLVKKVSKYLDGYLETNRKYDYKGLKGECDIFLLRKGVGYVFEVKTTLSNNSYKKAIKQLNKDVLFYKYWFGIDNFYKFIVYQYNKNSEKEQDKNRDYYIQLIK